MKDNIRYELIIIVSFIIICIYPIELRPDIIKLFPYFFSEHTHL